MKFLNYIALLMLVFTVTGCKKDLGNYDYTDTAVPVIDTAGIGGTYSVLRYTDFTLAPKVSGPEGHELTYQWRLYPRNRTSRDLPDVTELSDEPVLYHTIEKPVGQYSLELIVTDSRTGLKANTVFALDITSSLDYGLLVLYRTDEGGDVDFIKTPASAPNIDAEQHLKNIYSAAMGRPLPGDPKFIWASRFSTVNFISVGTDRYIGRFDGDEFAFLREGTDLFRRIGPVIKPEAYVYTKAFYNVLINDGKMQVTNITIEPDAKFGGEAEGNYRLAPYLTENVSSSLQAVGYDQLNGRFVRYFASSNTMVDFAAPAEGTGQLFDLRNIGKDMLYMTGGAQNYTFSFFKDRTGDGRWMYVTNFGGFTIDNGQLAINRYDMKDLPGIQGAKHYLVSGMGAFAYYATDQTIYNYAYSSSNTATVAFEVPAGERITAMSFYRPRPTSGLTDREERVLYLATWDGGTGRVYELAINETSGAIDATPNHVFEVDGEIVSLATKVK